MKATTLTAAQKTQLKALQAQVDTARQAHLTAAKNLKAFFQTVVGASVKFQRATVTEDNSTLITQ